MAELTRLGYLDERGLAYNLASSLAARKLFGRARVAAELKRRGLGAELVAEALERVFSEVAEDDMALQAARRMQGRAAGREPGKARERAARALMRRGFSRAAILRALAAAEREGAPDSGGAGIPGLPGVRRDRSRGGGPAEDSADPSLENGTQDFDDDEF